MSAHPPLDWPDYKSTRLRHPSQLRPLTATETELTAPSWATGRSASTTTT